MLLADLISHPLDVASGIKVVFQNSDVKIIPARCVYHTAGVRSLYEKGKGHVSFPNHRLFQPGTPLQAGSPKPNLTLFMWGCECVLSMCSL